MYRASYDGSNKKVMWQEMWRHEFEDALERDPVVIVPVGSVEQHGPHCPMDVDISAPFYMAVAVAQRVDDFPVIVAPPVWSGFTHYNMGFPGTINLRLETFQNLLADIFRSIYANGFKRIISVNGHGAMRRPVALFRGRWQRRIFLRCHLAGGIWWIRSCGNGVRQMKAWGTPGSGRRLCSFICANISLIRAVLIAI